MSVDIADAGKPCALGGIHTCYDPVAKKRVPVTDLARQAAPRGMVYCEHWVSDYACDRCCGRPDTYTLICESCGVPKDSHTEAEAMLCITRQIGEATDKPVYVAGREIG